MIEMRRVDVFRAGPGFARPKALPSIGLLLWMGMLGWSCLGHRSNPSPEMRTPTVLPTPSRTAQPTAPPIASPTPAPRLWRLTHPACCTSPFWSPDGREVWVIDRPDPEAPAGIWGIPLSGGAPRPVMTRLGVFSPDFRRVAYPEAGQTVIEDLQTGERWIAPTGGRAVVFSPDGEWIAWEVSAGNAPSLERRVPTLWIARANGEEARPLIRLIGGGFAGWFPDGEDVLVIQREAPGADPFLAVVHRPDGSLRRIAQGERLRGAQISPEGGWIAYQNLFAADPGQSGLWVVRKDGSGARRLLVFGAYRWRREGALLVIPLEPGAPSHRAVEIDAASGAIRPLTDPAALPFRIAGGDWALSPDGQRIVFVSAEDRHLWILELPSP